MSKHVYAYTIICIFTHRTKKREEASNRQDFLASILYILL